VRHSSTCPTASNLASGGVHVWVTHWVLGVIASNQTPLRVLVIPPSLGPWSPFGSRNTQSQSQSQSRKAPGLALF